MLNALAKIFLCSLFFIGLASSGTQAQSAAAQQPSRKADAPSAAFPARWKSLDSGTTKILRRDRDRIYVETILPDADQKSGCFNLAEVQKKAAIFAGTGHGGCVCQYTKGVGPDAQTYSNRWNLQYQIEITKVEPTRIEGRVTQAPTGSKLDCEKGTIDTQNKPDEWLPFVWIPE